MCCALQGSNNTTIAKYMRQNNWIKLEKIFSSATGQIGNWGGRYCSQIPDGSLYLEQICWRFFFHDQASPLKELPNKQRHAAKNVLAQLRRIYNETEKHLLQSQLSKNCSLSTVVTRFYDLSNKLRHDGYQSGVDRLEDILSADLK